jgi:hypothetical protein
LYFILLYGDQNWWLQLVKNSILIFSSSPALDAFQIPFPILGKLALASSFSMSNNKSRKDATNKSVISFSEFQ